MAARRMGQVLGGKGKIAMVACARHRLHHGARAGLRRYDQERVPRADVVDKRYGSAQFAQALQVAENILTAHPDLDGLFASNESTTVGTVQALKPRQGRIKMVGFDWSPALEEALKTGVVDSLVVQDPFRIGHDSVKLAVEKLNGGTPQKDQSLPPLLVDRDNLNDPAIRKQLNPDLKKYL